MISMFSMKEKLITFLDVVCVHCKNCNFTQKEVAATVLPAKSDSDVMFVYKVILDL